MSKCPVNHDFDPFTAAFAADPAAYSLAAIGEQPVFFSDNLDSYVVTKWADVREVFKNTNRFLQAGGDVPLSPLCPAAQDEMNSSEFKGRLVSLGNDDSPLHAERRNLLNEEVKTGPLKRLEPRIREILNQHIDKFITKGSADLISDLFKITPALVALDFMGVPLEENDETVQLLKRYSDGFATFFWGRPDDEAQVRAVKVMTEYQRFAVNLIKKIKKDPSGHGLLPLAARIGVERPELFPDERLNGMAMGVLLASHETTTTGSANMMHLLLEDRSRWEAVCANLEELAPAAVEESLRRSPPLVAWRRTAKEATQIGGVDIPAGGKILMLIVTGNHDDLVFDEPETFDLERANAKKHLSFGFGQHTCLGAPIARLQMKIAIEEIARRIPHINLAQEKIKYLPGLGRVPLSLKVEWDPNLNPVEEDRP